MSTDANDSAPLRHPVPPFTAETARIKVQAAEDAWNTRDPQRVAPPTPRQHLAQPIHFLTGRDEIEAFLTESGNANSTTPA